MRRRREKPWTERLLEAVQATIDPQYLVQWIGIEPGPKGEMEIKIRLEPRHQEANET